VHESGCDPEADLEVAEVKVNYFRRSVTYHTDRTTEPVQVGFSGSFRRTIELLPS
jgi:hypothetical protein